MIDALSTTDAGAMGAVRHRADRRSLARGLLIFGTYSVLYLATMIDAVAPFPLALNIAFGIGNGVCIAMLFIVGHDCCHSALVPGRRWNLWLGRLAFVPVVHSVSLWRLTHNQKHHGRTNLKGVDPVWTPMSPQEYAGASAARRWLERVYRGAFGPVIYYYIEIWLPLMIFPLSRQARASWRRHLPDTIFVLAGFAATLAFVALLGSVLTPERPLWLVLLLGWAIPFATFNYLAAITVYLNHTHPEIPWFADENAWSFYNGNVLGTAHVKMPFDIFPLYTDVMAHPAHHADVSAPVYALTAEQAALKARTGGDTKEYMLSLTEYRRILAACKLFDFERMCWTDFAGVPTGPRLEVRPADFALTRAKSPA
ncbi:MAG: fatty acid desaturase [Rhizomicrobium sp.]